MRSGPVSRIADAVRRLEPRLLLLLGGAAAGAWGFLAVAGEMTEGETLGVDRKLLLLLRTPGDPAAPLGSRSFAAAMRDISALGSSAVLTLVTVVAALAFVLHGRLRRALVLVGTVIAATATSQWLKDVYDRPRPELAPHGAYVDSASFPSGHSMLSAVTYLTLAMLVASVESRTSAKLMVFAVAFAIMISVGFTRVYLAVHWPSDVLARWCAGAAWAFAGWLALTWTVKRPVFGRGANG